jgi:hypothetical protein
MTLIELLWLSAPLLLSFLVWKLFFQHMGPWGAITSLILGCATFALLNAALSRISACDLDRLRSDAEVNGDTAGSKTLEGLSDCLASPKPL